MCLGRPPVDAIRQVGNKAAVFSDDLNHFFGSQYENEYTWKAANIASVNAKTVCTTSTIVQSWSRKYYKLPGCTGDRSSDQASDVWYVFPLSKQWITSNVMEWNWNCLTHSPCSGLVLLVFSKIVCIPYHCSSWNHLLSWNRCSRDVQILQLFQSSISSVFTDTYKMHLCQELQQCSLLSDTQLPACTNQAAALLLVKMLVWR